MAFTYDWGKFRVAKNPGDVSAEAAFNIISKIVDAEEDGEVSKTSKEKIVATAKKKSSVLHGFFEWDDSVAGHEHRLRQAADLVRAIVVVAVDDKPPVRAFVAVPAATSETGRERKNGFVSHTVLSESPILQRAYVRGIVALVTGIVTNADRVIEVFGDDGETLVKTAKRIVAKSKLSDAA